MTTTSTPYTPETAAAYYVPLDDVKGMTQTRLMSLAIEREKDLNEEFRPYTAAKTPAKEPAQTRLEKLAAEWVPWADRVKPLMK